MPEPLLTTAGVAELLSVSARTVRRLRADGGLPWVRIGGQVRYLREQVLGWVAGQAVATAVAAPVPRPRRAHRAARPAGPRGAAARREPWYARLRKPVADGGNA